MLPYHQLQVRHFEKLRSEGETMAKLFERNPRNVRIASWAMALGLFAAWHQYDKMKEREFSANEAQQWNEAVLRMHPRKAKKTAAERQHSEE